jgi:hypothetical protein
MDASPLPKVDATGPLRPSLLVLWLRIGFSRGRSCPLAKMLTRNLTYDSDGNDMIPGNIGMEVLPNGEVRLCGATKRNPLLTRDNLS